MSFRTNPTGGQPTGCENHSPYLIGIGASTGGVEAVQRLLGAFPENSPPVLLVQHIKGQFTEQFCERLDRNAKPKVVLARHGAPLKRGHVYVAPGNSHHLLVKGFSQSYCSLLATAPASGHRPSIDVLFRSMASISSPRKKIIGILLTGMGRDGAEGLLEIRQNGGFTISQEEKSCVVYGMPRAAEDIGAAKLVLPIEEIGTAIFEEVNR